MKEVSPAMKKEQLQQDSGWGAYRAGNLPLLASEKLNGAESNLSMIQTHTESACCVDGTCPEQPVEIFN